MTFGRPPLTLRYSAILGLRLDPANFSYFFGFDIDDIDKRLYIFFIRGKFDEKSLPAMIVER